MCFYLTATLPKETNLEKLRKFLDDFEMAFIPIRNDFIEPQLRKGELYFRATKNYCDCSTVLGSLNQRKEYLTLLNSKKVKILRKKKWTEDEIDEWVKNKLKNKKRVVSRNHTLFEGKKEVERWINFLHRLLDFSNVSRIGILKHWYSKGLEDESIILKETQRVNSGEISQDFLLNIEEDILYEFFTAYCS